MAIIAFDTIAYSQTLQDAGMEKRQADAIARAQKEALDEMISTKEIATKSDIQELRLEMEKIQYSMLKWQLGIGIALAVIMAKGFNWIGFAERCTVLLEFAIPRLSPANITWLTS